MKRILTLITTIPLFFIWCEKTLSNEIGYGEIENNTYTNHYFNMSIPVPSGWSIQSQAAIKEISNRGGNLIAGDNKNLQAVLKEAEKQTVNLFAFFKYEAGSPVEFNPSVIAVAERMTHMPGVKKGADYLFHVKKLLQTGQIEYVFPEEIYNKDITGISFDVLPAEINMADKTISQRYYSTKINDYVLSVILTHSSELESDELNQIFNTLNFQHNL